MATQFGTSGNDTLSGSPDSDTIVGQAGDDTINGGGGNDVILGNQGNDSITDGDGQNTVYGGMDNDQITVGNGSNLLFGNEGADTIMAGNGGNTIVGGQDSTDGADLITSGSGNDLILGNGGDDTVAAGGGADTVVGGYGADIILGNQGDDFLLGNQGDDTLYGGMGDDTLVGGQGNDFLIGGEGNDIAAFSSTRASYAISQNAAGDYILSGVDGIDTVSSVERFQFSDGTVDAANLIQGTGGGGGGAVNPPAPSADLGITATVSNARPVVGDQILFTDTLTNNGPDGATGVLVHDLLPAGVTFISAQPSQGTYNSATGAWAVGALSKNAQASLVITATASSYGSSTNTAAITHSDQTDSNATNNSSTVSENAVYNPQARPDNNTYVEGSNQPVTGNVLDNDIASPGELLTVENPGIYDGTYGSVTINRDGTYVDTPKNPNSDPNVAAALRSQGPHIDQLAYSAIDQAGVTTQSTLSITYLQPPTTVADNYTTQENNPLAVPANSGVLSNDTGDDQLTVESYTQPQHGALTLNRDGSLNYNPNQGYYGSDGFSYTATDGTLTSQPTQVNIAVTDSPPSTRADNYTTNRNDTLVVAANTGVLANDVSQNSLTVGSYTQPSHGTSVLNPDGSFNYVPSNNFFGTDTFTYTATDGTLSSPPTQVTINVQN